MAIVQLRCKNSGEYLVTDPRSRDFWSSEVVERVLKSIASRFILVSIYLCACRAL